MRDLSVDALFDGARAELVADTDPSHLVELHTRGTRDIFDRAAALCTSADELDRVLGAKVLRELGGPPPRFAAEAVQLLLPLLATEPTPRVLGWLISAIARQHMIGHLRDRLVPTPAVVSAVIAHTARPDVFVRYVIAVDLDCLIDETSPQPEAIRALIALSADPDADTRWYALACLVDDFHLTDLPAVRAAVEQRVSDDDPQIRTAIARVLAGGTFMSD